MTRKQKADDRAVRFDERDVGSVDFLFPVYKQHSGILTNWRISGEPRLI
ncbi:MAG: hypothetical protein WBL50_12725 [Candidatus Acidiferrum sp.]